MTQTGGPIAAPAGAEQFYSARLKQLAHLELPESQAAELWQSVARHRRTLFRKLGRDVGQRVALLDFIVNIRPAALEPEIIDRTTLAAIEHKAICDALTGLYNRHYFETALAREAERCRRYGVNSSLILVDVDLFKEVNDEHGHRVGDAVLQAVGALILQHVRAADVPCRFGGDEFAVIMPDTPQPVALAAAQRLCSDIEQWFEANAVCGNFIGVTVSCGVGAPTADAVTPERLFREADWALYESKRGGGNRVSGPVERPSQPESDWGPTH